MLFNNQDMFYYTQKIQCKGKPDKYTIFHKYTKDVKFEDVKNWAEKLKSFNNNGSYENYKCVSLKELNLPYNKFLSMAKEEVSNTVVDFFSVYSINSDKNKYIMETKADKETIFKMRELLKSNKLTYIVYSIKDGKFGIISLFRDTHKSIMEGLCLLANCSENHLNDIVDNY